MTISFIVVTMWHVKFKTLSKEPLYELVAMQTCKYRQSSGYMCKKYSTLLPVRMAERSKAPDSRVRTLSKTGVFWSTFVGGGSNPPSD